MNDFPGKILHADDDPSIHDLVRDSLSAYPDVEFVLCNSGQDFLDQIETFTPDLILLDLKMPGLTGVDAIQQIRATNPGFKTPIVLLTGYTDVKMCPDYQHLGVVGVLHKPLSIGVLPERIRFIWRAHVKRMDRL